MKSYIIKLLNGTSEEIGNIILKVIKPFATYCPISDKFSVSLSDFPLVGLDYSYFYNSSNPKSGIIENTPIHWSIEFDEYFCFWLE